MGGITSKNAQRVPENKIELETPREIKPTPIHEEITTPKQPEVQGIAPSPVEMPSTTLSKSEKQESAAGDEEHKRDDALKAIEAAMKRETPAERRARERSTKQQGEDRFRGDGFGRKEPHKGTGASSVPFWEEDNDWGFEGGKDGPTTQESVGTTIKPGFDNSKFRQYNHTQNEEKGDRLGSISNAFDDDVTHEPVVGTRKGKVNADSISDKQRNFAGKSRITDDSFTDLLNSMLDDDDDVSKGSSKKYRNQYVDLGDRNSGTAPKAFDTQKNTSAATSNGIHGRGGKSQHASAVSAQFFATDLNKLPHSTTTSNTSHASGGFGNTGERKTTGPNVSHAVGKPYTKHMDDLDEDLMEMILGN